MFKDKRRDALFGAAALLPAAGLGLDWLTRVLFSGSLCETDACEAAGGYLKFSENSLVLLGCLFFLSLFVLSRLPDEKKQYGWSAIWVLLIGALAFDGALMGYQATVPGPFCLLCAGTAAGLFLVLAAAALHGKFWVAFVLGLAVWCGGFSGNLAFEHSQSKGDIAKLPTMEEAAVAERTYIEAEEAEETENAKYCLFFSVNCPHCSEVIYNLARSEPEGRWYFSCVDQDPADLSRLAGIVRHCQEGIFFRILQAKKEHDTERPVPEKVRNAARKASAYFRSMDLPGVPTLVVKKRNGCRLYLPGTGNIARYLLNEGVVQEWYRFKKN